MIEIRDKRNGHSLLGWIKGKKLGSYPVGLWMTFPILTNAGMTELKLEVGRLIPTKMKPYLCLKADRRQLRRLRKIRGFVENDGKNRP